VSMIKRVVNLAPRHKGGRQTGRLSRGLTRLARLFGISRDPRLPNLKAANFNAARNIMDASVQETALQRAFDALLTPVLVIGEKLLILHANQEARHIFSDHIQKRNLALFLRSPQTLKEIRKTLADGQTRQTNVNVDAPLKRQYRLNISRLTSPTTEPLQVILEFQEMTLIHRSEAMHSEFVANVSHELRSPLATLHGFIETLLDRDVDTEARQRFLRIIEGEVQRMQRLIDDLLSLAKVELREHDRLRASVNLVDVIQGVANALASRAKVCAIKIRVQCPADLPPVVGDYDQLIQVMQNLIMNAIQYGADGGFVDITAKTNANGLPNGRVSVEVQVRDYGQGIDSEHLPRITERFYRADKSRSRAVGGTGLGLAIVKHIVSRHRGRLYVESEVGVGSLFKVLLPVYGDGTEYPTDTNL